jgi:hypothetical protein
MIRSGIGALALGLFAASCVNSEVTPIGEMYPAQLPGCPVAVFPRTQPPFPYVDVASARARCRNPRSVCIDRLRDDACLVGADVVYGFDEYVRGSRTAITATLARRLDIPQGTSPPSPPPASPAPPAPAPSFGCSPLCSPGFACRAGICEPQCNPRCEKGETCTRKRTCEPTRLGV